MAEEVVEVTVTESSPIVIGVSTTGSFSGSDVSGVAYHHVQGESSSQWEILHGLGFYPNVTVMDSGGSMVEGELEHYSEYSLRVTFSAPISGDAYLS